MNPLGVVLVTRRFWPLVGSAEKTLGHLAKELAARGCRVTVLTPQWSPRWPEEIGYHGATLLRLPYPQGGIWRTYRYLRVLGRWLRANRGQYDLVCVSGLRHSAYATIRAVRGDVPVVLRGENAGRQGDCVWQVENACGGRIKRQCLQAAAFVAPTPTIERELQAAGYPRTRIHHVPYGVPIPPRGPSKAQARDMLTDANAALAMPEGTPMAIYLGQLQQGRGLERLILAWATVTAALPEARLWLVGGGPEADVAAIQRQIHVLKLADRVILAGVFEEVDELLAAADLLVLPELTSGVSLSLLEGMAAGTPVVVGDTADNRTLVADGREGRLVAGEDAAAWAAAILELLREPARTLRLGAAARQRAEAQFPLAQMVDRHVTLWENLVGRNIPSPPAPLPRAGEGGSKARV